MTWEEREILTYLKNSPKAFFSAREISRRAAGKRVYAETPHWAKPFLPKMVEKGILEMDASGYYRIKPKNKEIEARGRKWVSPQMARLLKTTEKDFSNVATVEISEEDATLE